MNTLDNPAILMDQIWKVSKSDGVKTVICADLNSPLEDL
jgi:hypothetical protein